MGTGNFELRGDGTIRQWCIESQSPGGGAKLDIGALNDAVLGVRVNSHAALLRTHPPEGSLPSHVCADMYTETSSPRTSGEKFDLRYTCGPGAGADVSWWYHMYGRCVAAAPAPPSLAAVHPWSVHPGAPTVPSLACAIGPSVILAR